MSPRTEQLRQDPSLHEGRAISSPCNGATGLCVLCHHSSFMASIERPTSPSRRTRQTIRPPRYLGSVTIFIYYYVYDRLQ